MFFLVQRECAFRGCGARCFFWLFLRLVLPWFFRLVVVPAGGRARRPELLKPVEEPGVRAYWDKSPHCQLS